MSCIVPCSSTSFAWLVFFFGVLLWGSMIHKHTVRWMWQGSASVVSCKCCCCLCYPGGYLRLGTLISYSWAQVLEACDCLKLLSICFDLCVVTTGVVCHQLGLLGKVSHDGERCIIPAYHSLEGFQHIGIFQLFVVKLEACVFWLADFFQAKVEGHHQQVVITSNVCSWKTCVLAMLTPDWKCYLTRM